MPFRQIAMATNLNTTKIPQPNPLKAEDNSARNVWTSGFLQITTSQSTKPIYIPVPTFESITANRPSDCMTFEHPLFLSILRGYKIQIDPIDKHTLIYQGVNVTDFDLLDRGGFYCALGDWASRPLSLAALPPLDATLSSVSKRQPVETLYQITRLADAALSPSRHSRVRFRISKPYDVSGK